MKIRLNSFLSQTNVEGPGMRFCLWVQGCSIRCRGCANSDMWDFNGGKEYSVEHIINLIKLSSNQIEGITFLGGEPLDQIEAVTYISKAVQNMGLSVIVFTGYEYDVIKEKIEVQKLKECIDILIDGNFREEDLDYSRPWVGSANQEFHFFTEKYSPDILTKYTNKIEIRIDKNREISLNGMGNYKKILNSIKG